MNIYPLVFSNNPRYRVTRHILYWLLWITYFTFMYFFGRMGQITPGKGLLSAFCEILLFTPVDLIHCYLIIYFLLPRYLFKGRYLTFIFLWLLFTVCAIAATQPVLHYLIAPVRESFGLKKPTVPANLFVYFYNNFGFFNLQGCLAAAIKLGKMWYIKQLELNLMKSEMQKIDSAAEEGKMQPVFLINALARVGELSAEKPAVVPGMVKKIQNLLRYVIYDNNQASVPLKKELKLLEEYIELEKTSSGEPIDTRFTVSGNIAEENIAPFIILPLAENSFRQLAALDMSGKSILIEIHAEDGRFLMQVAWSKPTDSSALANGVNTFLLNMRRRLNLIYPESHEIKVVIKTDQFIVDLSIDLHRAIG